MSTAPWRSTAGRIRLRDHAFVADSGGYQALITWAETHARIEAFGVEGTGSRWRQAMARAVRRAGHRVVEVNRGDRGRGASRRRQVRHPRWPRIAARSRTGGSVDSHSQDRGRRRRDDAPAEDHAGYRGEGAHHGDEHAEADRRARLAGPTRRPPRPHRSLACSRAASRTPTVAPSSRPPRPPSIPSGRSPAAGWLSASEIAIHDQHLTRLKTETSPTLREGFGVGAHTAAELLIDVFGDNPAPDSFGSRLREALRRVVRSTASSGMTTGRHRLDRGGHRHANAALNRAVIVRMRYHQPTVDYVARPHGDSNDGRTKSERPIRCGRPFLARAILPARHLRISDARQVIIQAACIAWL